MAILITAEDIKAFAGDGRKSILVDVGTLITPSAKDAAFAAGIAVEYGCDKHGCGSADNGEGIDPDLIFRALSAIDGDGASREISSSGPRPAETPYVAECDPSGLKIISGGTVQMEYLDTGNPSNQVHYQEVICSKNSNVFNAGFLEIDRCAFDWEVGCDEMYYVIAGPLNITVNGRTYIANSGDVVNLPVGHTVVFSAPGRAKMFYGIKAA